MKTIDNTEVKEKKTRTRKAAKNAASDAEKISKKNAVKDADAMSGKVVPVDSAILLDITRHLAALNENIAGRRPSPYDADATGSNLFGFELKGNASAEEYRRYFTFLDTVTDVLSDYGIHLGNNGYAYMIDAVKIIIDRNSLDMRLKSDIYPLVARRYHLKGLDTVEHSIRNAINKAYNDNKINPGCNRMSQFAKRPTNKQFLVYIASTVLRAMYDSLAENAG